MGLEPGVAGWKAQTNPLSNGGTPGVFQCLFYVLGLLLTMSDTEQQDIAGDEAEHEVKGKIQLTSDYLLVSLCIVGMIAGL